MSNNTKLELTWYGKEDRISVEPRILLENTELSNIANEPNTKNMLIHGDNLLALKALEQNFAGKIKCIYIDPPYNTGNAFNKYDDNIEHSIWLSLMRERLALLNRLLSDDGIIFVQINDDESAYLKVLLDEIFGRNNYEATLYVKVRHENRILREDSKYQLCIEQVHCYRKTQNFISPRREKTRNSDIDYKWNVEIIGEPSEKTKIAGYDVEIYSPKSYKITKTEDGLGFLKQYSIRGSLITQKASASEYYEFNLKNRRNTDGLGTLYKVIGMGTTGDGLGYRYIMQPEKQSSKNGLYFQGRPIKNKDNKGLPYPNFYDMTDIFNNVGYEGSGYFNGGKKPEAWIDFLLSLANIKKGDYVLDSFLGSGTTAAVALKKGFNFIGIEMGEHAYSLCKTRLDNIINEEDKYGIPYKKTKEFAYRFYELAPTLIKKDRFGCDIINPAYNAEMLSAAVCKHENFVYNPDPIVYWKQAKNDNTYLYITTQHISANTLQAIHNEMKENENLVIIAKSFDDGIQRLFKNTSIKKIPQSLLGKCEYGKDDYSLNIISLPDEEADDE